MPTGVEVTVDGFNDAVEMKLTAMDGTERTLSVKLKKTPTGSLVSFTAEDDAYTITLPTADDIAAFLRMALVVFMPGYHLVKTH